MKTNQTGKDCNTYSKLKTTGKNRTGVFAPMKRTLFLVLSLIMCLSLFPAVTFAEGETVVSVSTEDQLLGAIVDAGSTPTVINVTEDISFSGLWFLGMPIDIPSGADITIKASGKDITFTRFADDLPIFDVKSGGKLTLSSDGDNTLTIDGNHVLSSVSAIVVSGELVTDHVDFMNHTLSSGNGAALSCSGASASCTVNGGTFKDNIGGTSGGAIAVTDAALTIDGATFENNTVKDVTGNGGAIYCKNSAIDFKNATFTNNSAMVGGAVEFTSECTGTVESSTFKNNKADGIMGKGGALDFDHCIAVSIISGVFEDNYASTWGGAIYTDGEKSDFFMNTVLFVDNSASLHGGAIWHCPLGTSHYYTYSGMMVWNNSAAEAGADMYLSQAKPGLENGGEYVSDKTYAGNYFNWCYDTAASRYDAENPDFITDKSYYQGSNVEIAMKSHTTEEEYLSVKDAAGIVFKGNSSTEGGAIANNGFIEVGYKSGLTIEKKVTGENAPADDVFSFTVQFSDGSTYDGIESGSTVTLKGGERLLISDVPQGIVATVSELPKANYTPVEATQEAIIGEYGSELIFVNHYVAPVIGNLTVSKSVTGTGTDKTKAFSFTVTLSDTAINETYGDMTFVDGVATFDLKDGESKTATGLTAGMTYTVVENDSSEYTVTKTNDTGTIIADTTVTVLFNNHLDIDDANKITVTVEKVWQDDNSPSRPTSVTVQLYQDGTAYGEPVTLNAENNWQTEWNDLDGSFAWSVDEVNVPNGYIKTIAKKDNHFTITNKIKSAVSGNSNSPQTGDTSNIALWITLLLLSAGAAIALGVMRKHKHGKANES